ncbi:MAG TPA: IPT/TIG domain-containing protein [Thermoanaerobaculia bacterium]|jgi:hypothetical protein
MTKLRQRKVLFALLAILVMFVACKGDSPTAPPPSTGGGNPPGGGTPPPTGVTIALSTTNATPFVASTTTITANVTQGGNPVPDGTAVEFSVTGLDSAAFTDTNTAATLKTTVNGVATVGLTASALGTATVTAFVGNVSRSINITFVQRPTVPPPTDTTPAITGVSPTTGRPAGGQNVRITGRNFRSPVRVFFEIAGQRREALVTNVTATTIDVITPAINLTTETQQQAATIVAIFDPGTANEVVVTATQQFTYQLDILTPVITAISPAQGPSNGGTIATIFGQGFQAPVQVFFGDTSGPNWTQVQVIDVTFNQIRIVTPPGRDVSSGGNAPVVGPVDLRIVNIDSNTSSESENIFRYAPGVQVTAAGPTQGLYTGGTEIRIDGTGFDDPVAVTVAGVAATVIRVTGTQILARTNGVIPDGCDDVSGPIVVTNIESGDSDDGPTFSYLVTPPIVTSISPRNPQPGQSITVNVLNPGAGTNTFQFGDDLTLFPATSIIAPDGSTGVFTFTIPMGFEFETVACVGTGGVAGVRARATPLDLTITNAITECESTLAGAITVTPADLSCVIPPPPVATVTNPGGECPVILELGPTPVGTPRTGTITVLNSAPGGSQSLTLTLTGSSNNAFSVTPATGSAAPGAAVNFTVSFNPAVVGNNQASTITFQSNDPANQQVQICVEGDGTAPGP